MISEQQFIDSAAALGCDLAAIKAVAQVESGGSGIINDRPVILFEPHVFYRELKTRNITPVLSDICYPVWGTHPYPKGQDAQYERLDRAAKIHREAALCSASWGKFQILASHYKECGCLSLQQFINNMYVSEDKHLEMFCHYVISEGLDDELRAFSIPSLIIKASRQFASVYNGKYYFKHNYDGKLRLAYLKFKVAFS